MGAMREQPKFKFFADFLSFLFQLFIKLIK